jgi:hypothetical protein
VPATGILCVVIFVSKEAGSQTKGKRKNGKSRFADRSLTVASQRNLKKKKKAIILCYLRDIAGNITPDVLYLY